LSVVLDGQQKVINPACAQGKPFMSPMNLISMTTRIADLDSLRHVNNRTYEQFCSEGRYRLLEEHGYSIDALLDQAITLRPLASFVKFSRQQKAGSILHVETEAYSMGNGHILWDHRLVQPDGEIACVLQAKSATLDRQGRPVDLLPSSNAEPGQFLVEEIPDFSGRCARISSNYSAIYTDMDAFGNLPFAALWRIFEEGRHMFGEQIGLTLEKLIELDSHIFWVSGTYQYYKPINAGQNVKIYSWLERAVRIRACIRQEIHTADEAELLGASREEHLLVSLSQTRARTMPPGMKKIINPYLEYQE
jgi:acyl-CoA thioesterase FadM